MLMAEMTSGLDAILNDKYTAEALSGAARSICATSHAWARQPEDLAYESDHGSV